METLHIDRFKRLKKIKKGNSYVVFDRKCQVKDDNGIGSVDIFVYLARRERKYINVGQCKKSEFEDFQYRREVQSVKNRCDKVLAALPVLNLDLTVDNFNAYYYSEDEKQEMNMEPKNLYKGTDHDTDFIEYFRKFIMEEHTCQMRSWKNSVSRRMMWRQRRNNRFAINLW